ncbi:MAG TPA: ectonucleotide pyrophosphatase/phosphodiesterase [Acidobacteriaceae bacterium]|nr:ectonucleotide pyrophosphatase/phosphodiesterase [Acidobacteriaceae bacterium]
MPSRLFALSLLVLISLPLAAQTGRPVLMISVDGMRPDYVTHAAEHHLHIPNLLRVLAQGAHAEGVQGVFPTVTYPSHTTLVTGVWPARHGILNNAIFDPERRMHDSWYWYNGQIKVPTLWSAAHSAGLSTASVGWPVTVDADCIDYLIPEYWRGASAADPTNPDDRMLMDAVSRPDNELRQIAERTATPYMNGNDTTIDGDEAKTIYSLDILRRHRPRFMTIHLSSLDEEEHMHGPFSPEADKDLERIDGMIGRLVTQELANDPDAVIAIVSDHGFADISRATNLFIPFIQAGLVQAAPSSKDGAPRILSWKAEPWLAGGMAAIILHDPSDAATTAQVRGILDKLAADSDSGVARILNAEQMQRLGGFPGAAFVVTLKPGYVTGPGIAGPLVTAIPHGGTHGYDPTAVPEMRSSFFILGKGVLAGKDLGVVDMRQIAPTIAGLLGISLPDAAQKSLSIR